MERDLGCCQVRSWRRSDADSLARHANNRNIWLKVRDRFPHPYTVADARRWIRGSRAASPETHFAIAVDGEAVGGIGYNMKEDVHHRSAEIGYWLGETYWGRGIVTAAVEAVTAHAFATHDLCRISARVFETNPASMRVLEKAGYQYEGRFRRAVTKAGRTLDELIYAVIRE